MTKDWHKEILDKMVEDVSQFGEKLMRKEGINFDGWYEWFEKNHPKVFSKYYELFPRIASLRFSSEEAHKKEFQKLCKQVRDVEIWALEQYAKKKKRTGGSL